MHNAPNISPDSLAGDPRQAEGARNTQTQRKSPLPEGIPQWECEKNIKMNQVTTPHVQKKLYLKGVSS